MNKEVNKTVTEESKMQYILNENKELIEIPKEK